MTSIYRERPWLARYDKGQPYDIEPEYANALELFAASVRRSPDAPIIRYFDGTITLRELDGLSDAFACGLLDQGIAAGDRVALYLQNVPQFVIALLGAWKAGAIAVSVNPMNKERELDVLLRDSGAKALVCLESLYATARAVFGGLVVTTSELEHQTGNDQRIFAGVERIPCAGAVDMSDLVSRFRGQRPPAVSPAADDVAFLTYTSGTTGPPKGAMNTHRNVVFNAQAYRDWMSLGDEDVVLGVAPLFHITGLIAHIAVALVVPMPLVLYYRFDPEVTLELIERYKATFTVGSITVFISLMNAPSAKSRDISSLQKVYSGGAPIAPPTVEAYEQQFGAYIHNIYGLTETTSPSHAVPFKARAPVDETSGALSVGVPIFNTIVKVVDEDRS